MPIASAAPPGTASPLGRDAPSRRAVVAGIGAVVALAGHVAVVADAFAQAAGGAPQPIAPDHVKRLAERLAAREFVAPRLDVPPPFNALTSAQYNDIRFRSEQAIWRGERLDYEVQALPFGWLYTVPVELWIVEAGMARPLMADSRLFALGADFGKAPDAAPFGFSGFRIHGPINRADLYDEYVSFQGASYFRAVGRNQRYGLSARGLAIDTARPGGEEFPVFRAFWIERPAAGAPEIVVHALLDSASTTGAYRIAIQAGAATVMDVEVTLYPRRPMAHVGIAPLTSMYLSGTASRRLTTDIRPAVHNSEGLAMVNGRGERLWRPVTNPKKLQASAFIDRDPKGFGLAQRDRAFHAYEDVEAQFHRRPTLWIEPRGAWGEGYVELIEIPAEEDFHDNIVVYWKPARELEAGRAHTFTYRMSWGESVPVAWAGARVAKTRIGPGRKPDQRVFAIDFDGPAVKFATELPKVVLQASGGSLTNVMTLRHGEIGGLRVAFELATAGHETIELRLVLEAGDQPISETWVFRWTRA